MALFCYKYLFVFHMQMIMKAERCVTKQGLRHAQAKELGPDQGAKHTTGCQNSPFNPSIAD